MKTCNFTIQTKDMQLSVMNEHIDISDDTLMVFGLQESPHTISELKQIYNVNKIIAFNSEQVGSIYDSQKYINKLNECDEVWDYDEENIKHFSQHVNLPFKHHVIKRLYDIKPSKKEYDVLFYGTMNGRRSKIIQELEQCGISVCTPNVFCEELDSYIAKSKILLNIHFYNSMIQEQARMCRWYGNGIILSERSKHNYYGIYECDYEKIVSNIKLLLNDINNVGYKNIFEEQQRLIGTNL